MPKKEPFIPDDATGVPLPAALPILPAGAEDRTDYGYILDWMRRGMPDEEIFYSADAPATTEEQWALGVKAKFEFTKENK
jgi:hypothetical protein